MESVNIENMASSKRNVGKEDHLRLAGVIKGIHRQLRRDFRESDGDYSRIWTQHLQRKDDLVSYAQAMHQLAEQHWSVYPETRIDWCQKVIIEYFLCDGLRRALEKDAKRKYFEQQRLTEANPEEINDEKRHACFVDGEQNVADAQPVIQDYGSSSSLSNFNRPTEKKVIPIELSPLSSLANGGEKIRLLDVGSCYNPFGALEELDVVAIDICPATEGVYQCDFLQLQTTASPQTRAKLPPEAQARPTRPPLPPLASPITHLPRASFHVVVFCLLLEYLPSPFQRLQCCLQAQRLLARHGLLLVVTPDSHSPHRNAPMMKSWRCALESLGFSRWKYEKKDHIHCLAFRKVSELTDDVALTSEPDWTKSVAEQLFIPQDFNDACYEGVKGDMAMGSKDIEPVGEQDDLFLAHIQNELPLMLNDEEIIDDTNNDDDSYGVVTSNDHCNESS